MSSATGERDRTATTTATASGMARAAAYMAEIAEAPLAIVPVGTMRSGRTRPMTEKPVATSTLMSVTAEARRIPGFGAVVMMVDDSTLLVCHDEFAAN
jgi:ABC-type amino acid transport system permease subunit